MCRADQALAARSTSSPRIAGRVPLHGPGGLRRCRLPATDRLPHARLAGCVLPYGSGVVWQPAAADDRPGIFTDCERMFFSFHTARFPHDLFHIELPPF